jgi:hypothetical protein
MNYTTNTKPDLLFKAVKYELIQEGEAEGSTHLKF